MLTKMLTKMLTTKKNTPAPRRVIPLSDGNLEQVVGGIKGSLPAPPLGSSAGVQTDAA